MLEDKFGFNIDTPSVLNSYWNMFVERSLESNKWASGFVRHPQPYVIDVGANAGAFIHLLDSMNSNVSILAFEPLPKMAERISSWIQNNELNVELLNCACSDSDSKSRLFYATPDDTTATLESNPSANREELIVDIKTLDSVVEAKKVYLIKIDTEGHELAVLKGARQTLDKTSFLIIEAHDDEALAKLNSFLGPQWLHEKLDPSNYLFYKGKI